MAKKKKKKDKKDKKDKKSKKAQAAESSKAKDKAKAKKKAEKQATGKPDALRALADRIVALTTANDEEGILSLYADNVESAEMNMPPTVGREALRAKFDAWSNMVSDPRFTATNVWTDNGTIIIEWVGDVTLKATGKHAQLREIAVHEVENGKIVRERYYYDPAALQP